MLDPVMIFIICLFIVISILHRLDTSKGPSKEHFEVYHPTNYEMKPLLPCRQFNLNFNCANEVDDLDNHYSNTCQTPTCGRDPSYVMSKSLGRPRICRQL